MAAGATVVYALWLLWRTRVAQMKGEGLVGEVQLVELGEEVGVACSDWVEGEVGLEGAELEQKEVGLPLPLSLQRWLCCKDQWFGGHRYSRFRP